MAEEKIIPIITSTRTEEDGTILFIKSAYFSDLLPNTIQALIASMVGELDGTSYIEGELILQVKNYPDAINYSINSDGELIVMSATGDVNNYSINDNQELIWEGDDNS